MVLDGIGVGSTVIVGAADFKNESPDATRRFDSTQSLFNANNLVEVIAVQ